MADKIERRGGWRGSPASLKALALHRHKWAMAPACLAVSIAFGHRHDDPAMWAAAVRQARQALARAGR
jgi:hypothetical protein